MLLAHANIDAGQHGLILKRALQNTPVLPPRPSIPEVLTAIQYETVAAQVRLYHVGTTPFAI